MATDYKLLPSIYPATGRARSLARDIHRAATQRIVNWIVLGDSQRTQEGGGSRYNNFREMLSAICYGDIPATPWLYYGGNAVTGFFAKATNGTTAYGGTSTVMPVGNGGLACTANTNGTSVTYLPNGDGLVGVDGKSNTVTYPTGVPWLRFDAGSTVNVRSLWKRTASNAYPTTLQCYGHNAPAGTFFPSGSGTAVNPWYTAGELTGTGFVGKVTSLTMQHGASHPYPWLRAMSNTADANNAFFFGLRLEKSGGAGIAYLYSSASGFTINTGSSKHLAANDQGEYWAAIGISADVIEIDLATNDAGGGCTAAQFKLDFIALIAMWRQWHPNALFIFNYRGQIPASSGGYQAQFDQYAGAIAEVADVDDRVLVINCRPQIERMAPYQLQWADPSGTFKIKGDWTSGTNATVGQIYRDVQISDADTVQTYRLFKCLVNTNTRPTIADTTNWSDITWVRNKAYSAGDIAGWWTAKGMWPWRCVVAHTSTSNVSATTGPPGQSFSPNWVPLAVHLDDDVHESASGQETAANVFHSLWMQAVGNAAGSYPGTGGSGLSSGSTQNSTGTGMAV